MAAPSEIEKLERRYAENPDGRFFAPLADAYRKAGNVVRALELVRAGLAKHPDYLSAHIVLGRCLLDKGDDAEAEATFRSVLDLDAENIIALKSLAEITERTGRTLEARQWLQKLLVVDSMNVEAEADLQRLGGVIAQQPTQEIEPVRSEADVSFADVAREVEAPAAAAAPEPVAPAPAPEPFVAAASAPRLSLAPEAPPEPVAAVPPPPPAPVPAEPMPVFQPAPTPPEALPRFEAAAPPPIEAAAPPAEPVVTPPVETAPAPAAESAAPPAEPFPAPPVEAAAEPAAAPEGFVPISGAPPEDAPVEATATPDRHPLPQDLQVAESGLELMPFDDSLAWGTGERSSRAIRAEDIASVSHDDNLTTPAVEFLAGLEPPADGAAPVEPASGQGSLVEPPSSPPTFGAPEEFAVERQDEMFFGSAAPPPPTENIDLPADLSGSYSIIDMPEAVSGPPAPPAPEALRPSAGLPLILPEDVTPADELARPSAKLVQMVSPAPPEERAPSGEQPMLTETLGDLYLSQGFRGEAADVYRRLLSQRPGDEALRAKLRALESPPADLSAAALGAESVGVWLSRIAAARLPAPVSPLPAEASPGPSPLEAAFATPAEPAGEPAHPANDAFSLDQIFGAPADAPPAPAPPGAAAPAPTPPPPGASFDEFFGAPPEAGSVRPVARAPDAPAQPGEEDLSAFNAWLQGLKR